MNKAERIEKLAKWRAKQVYPDLTWDDFDEFGSERNNKAVWRKRAEAELDFLATLGAVWLADDQTAKIHDMNNATFAEGYAAAVGDLKNDGWRKVEGA